MKNYKESDIEQGWAILPVLVRRAKAGWVITYLDLAREIGAPSHRRLGKPLDYMNEQLEKLEKKWGEEIPQIQCIVVLKGTGLPSRGAKIPNVEEEWVKVFAYKKWGSVLAELAKLNPNAKKEMKKSLFPQSSASGGGESQSAKAQSRQGEGDYHRVLTQKSMKIERKHSKLSNSFCDWLKDRKVHAEQEKEGIDILFDIKDNRCIAELKVVYGVNTTRAIREAMGQLLEYNFYESREEKEQWMIVLDQEPSEDDKRYIDDLRSKLKLPLIVGWHDKGDFKFHPNISTNFNLWIFPEGPFGSVSRK